MIPSASKHGRHTCRGMDDERLIRALARTHAELVLIHPFRQGNGRLARLLNTLMAFQAGQPALDYGGIRGKKKREYIAAIHVALGGDYEPMEAVFRRIELGALRPDPRIALREAPAGGLSRHLEIEIKRIAPQAGPAGHARHPCRWLFTASFR